MIITEFFMTRRDGISLFRTFSDKGMFIERDGVLYEEAIDPEDTNRKYTETNVPISVDDEGQESEVEEEPEVETD